MCTAVKSFPGIYVRVAESWLLCFQSCYLLSHTHTHTQWEAQCLGFFHTHGWFNAVSDSGIQPGSALPVVGIWRVNQWSFPVCTLSPLSNTHSISNKYFTQSNTPRCYLKAKIVLYLLFVCCAVNIFWLLMKYKASWLTQQLTVNVSCHESFLDISGFWRHAFQVMQNVLQKCYSQARRRGLAA